jgi:hypothetical protein
MYNLPTDMNNEHYELTEEAYKLLNADMYRTVHDDLDDLDDICYDDYEFTGECYEWHLCCGWRCCLLG